MSKRRVIPIAAPVILVGFAAVLPALMRKFHEATVNNANTVTVWGTGKPLREFLHVDDLADACVFLMNHYEDSEIINIGVGKDISISELADLIKDIVGFKGSIHYDRSKPDGTPRKLLDVSKLQALGWQPKISLRQGIEMTYRWYVKEEVPKMPKVPKVPKVPEDEGG